MSELVETRVIEICDNEWVAQFAVGIGGWTTFSDTFETQEAAQKWLDEQINTADPDAE